MSRAARGLERSRRRLPGRVAKRRIVDQTSRHVPHPWQNSTVKTFESTPAQNIRFRRAAGTNGAEALGDTVPAVATRPSATGISHQLESPTSETRMGRRLDSPDTRTARKRQELVSKEHARATEQVKAGGAAVSPRGGAPIAGGPEPGQGKTAVVRVRGPNKKPLPLSIVRAGIPQGATETAKNAAGCAVEPVRLIASPGFQILSVVMAGVERLREEHRKEGVPSERFAADAPPEQTMEFLDLAPVPGNKSVAIKVKRVGEEDRFEATLYAVPCEEPVVAPAVPTPPVPVPTSEVKPIEAPPVDPFAPLPPPSFDPFT